jgi:hypothetical protein
MGSMLRRLAPLTTTGVGSLPFTRPGDAARHAVHEYELPFCPQLPRAYGDMVEEWLGTDPGRCGWAPDRDQQLPAVWDAFVLELERHPPAHGVVKLQVTGPLTLAMALERGSALGRCDLGGLAREISGWLAAAVRGQVGGLAELGLSGLVMVDEPGLMAGHDAGADPTVWDALRGAAPAWGLHVCGEVPWDLLDVAEPDVISYDLGRYGCGPTARTVISRLIRRGGRIMWGAADPARAESPAQIIGRVGAAARAVAGADRSAEDVVLASLLSGGCGTGGVECQAERRLAAALEAAARLLRGDPMPAQNRHVPLLTATVSPWSAPPSSPTARTTCGSNRSPRSP